MSVLYPRKRTFDLLFSGGRQRTGESQVQKQQIEISGHLDFDNCSIIIKTLSEIVDRDYAHLLTQSDVDRFREAFEAFLAVASAIGNEVKARHYAVNAPKSGYSQRSIELQRLANGGGRG